VDVPSLFTDRETAFLEALVVEGVDFLVVGLAAAALQGAPAVTQDVDLWFADLTDSRFRTALERAGVTYIPPTAATPPLLAGGGTELFDIVVHMHGLGTFREEAANAVRVQIGRVPIPALPLSRILVSKRATGRPKDLAIIPALEDAIRAGGQRSSH
jgi:hypothetical protein